MNRRLWMSSQGEPLATAEVAMVRVATLLLCVMIMTFANSGTVGPSVVEGWVAYLLLDRLFIIAQWIDETRRERAADRRMMAALNTPPVRARMAVRA